MRLGLEALLRPRLGIFALAATTRQPSRTATTQMAAKELPYGSWPSPITANFITSSGVRLGSLSVDGEGELYWLEGRPQEKGRQVVVRYAGEHKSGKTAAPKLELSERGAVDVTPKETNVRTRVHEYGGGAYLLDAEGAVIYSDFATQRLYRAAPGGAEPVCLTPESSWPAGRYRFADGCVAPGGRSLVAVREDHGPEGKAKPTDVVNEVVSIALDGSGAMTVLATGRDFYAHPRVSPDGSQLAYVAWNHPSMPWDATELRLAQLGDGAAPATDGHVLLDGADADTSVIQPAWHPSSGALYYVSDSSGFYNLRRVPPGGATAGVPVLPREVDFGGSSPGWSLGQQGYTFLPDGRVAATAPDKEDASGTVPTKLLVFDDAESAAAVAASLRVFGEAEGLPPNFGSPTPAPDGTLYLLGGAADVPAGVYAWRGLAEGGGGGGGAATLLACSSSARVPDSCVSVPKLVEFPCPLGSAYGYYYAPRNAEYTSSEAAPPLLVKAHGGPTGATSSSFNPGIQFWTSRGFAVLDVDYGGSTGYGRDYRRRLRGAWGVVDIDDVCAGAQHLVAQGLADPARLAIDGGSAGGYTTLGALAFRDVFKAGCSLYGVADLGLLAGDTHKFESRYLDGLVGPYPQEKALYDARAPINAIDKLSCPILLLQGDEDKIVPPNQAETMHAALLKKGLPCALKIYEGEQHGFRKAENIEDALNSELFFFSKVFGFTCAGDDVKPFEIDNLAVA